LRPTDHRSAVSFYLYIILTDLAFGQVVRRIASSMALVVY
jgi:heme/copper-type cytochrome/quinol oxidase subunit 4